MSRSRRRIAVAGLYLGYVVLGGTWCLEAGEPSSVDLGILAIAGIVSLSGLFVIWRATGALMLTTVHLLDERQRAVRDRAFRISYFIVSLILLALTATYSWLAVRAPARTVATPLLVPLGIGALLVAMTLPLAVVAWTEPDPPEDSGTFTKTAK